MSSIQSDDMIKGRVLAMRSMIAQFQNEISQLEDSLRHRQQPPPSVPDGFILHDGNPITNHSMIEEVIWRNGETHRGCIGVFNWHGAKPYLGNNQEVIAYRLKAEKPAYEEIVEDARNAVTREIYEVIMHGMGANLANLDNALEQFAQAIISECKK